MTHGRIRRFFWLVLAWVSLGLAMAGALLPLLPTTPFLLLSAWAATRGSPRLALWLHEHPRFGPMLYAWREEGAIPRSAKITGVLLMLASWLTLFWLGTDWRILAVLGLLFALGGTWLATRPLPGGRR
ncbi:YbaN family protein [Microbulbifer halophilus]|uniref:Inner membrane protein n=1 Tax=Microbulbifer halophilus TaxID=453963 RepID=A0ABW5E7A0_9GAMM|nr:YbaN family protein [Microbulbifer halophilus]MCW8125553.1 YbaN family protein [Microbulbifer halophilus]